MSEHPGKMVLRNLEQYVDGFGWANISRPNVRSIASYVSDLERRLEKAEAERDGWQPMATAPKDGTPILCYCDPRDYPFLAYFAHVGRYTSTPKMWVGHPHGAMDSSSISAWMPLPEPRALKSATPPQGDEA